jgi:predicted anti-sigma-YlaC factor YlaD
MMNSCASYEMHISALIDGEAGRADTLAILDHMPACASCQAFYRDCRQLQDVVDALPVAPEADFERAGGRRIVPLPRPARWVWAAAASIAALLVAAGIWLRPSVPAGVDLGPRIIDLSVQTPSAPMNDTRFMEISVALLHAEPRYQRTMIEILERYERGRGLDESSVDVASAESGEPWTRTEFDETEARGAGNGQPQP